MAQKIKLKTSTPEFKAIHEAVDKSRQSSEFVKVPRQALVNLLLDHGALLERVPHDIETE